MQSEFQMSQTKIDNAKKTDWPLIILTLVTVVPCFWLVVKHFG